MNASTSIPSLLVNQLRHAYGVVTPSFGWKMESARPGATQAAYRLRVYEGRAAEGAPAGTVFLVDAVQGLRLPGEIRPIIHGDRLSYAIAAASILAKVERDRYMRRLDAEYPGYGFAEHKGYGTRAHLDALAKLGPCPEHRRSFGPVMQMELGL